ncbi:hypothetical protein Ct61P_11796 [Colletotrichum tofieldiae]|nr:hypothetical protein Ct61P_11796 [Colletotrichum tofieldiae]
MSAVTPSTGTTAQSPADLFIDDSTLGDSILRRFFGAFDSYKGTRRAQSTQNLSVEAHFPQRGSSEVRRVIVEINVTKAEYKRVRGLFEHLMRDENATPAILEAAVDTASSRLVRAIEDEERIQNGNPPRHLPYPPKMIPQLLAAVEKAEADRDNWYAETNRLFWLVENIDKRKMPALKLKLEGARQKEAAARQREGVLAAGAACQKPIAPFGRSSGTGNASNSSPAPARRMRPGETPIASPVTSDFSNQATLVKAIRNAMRRASDAGAPETPTGKARR